MLTDPLEQLRNGDSRAALERYRSHHHQATSSDNSPEQRLAWNNHAVLEACYGSPHKADELFEQARERWSEDRLLSENQMVLRDCLNTTIPNDNPAQRVAVVSLLFNWPSTGGGTVHTFELCDQLHRSGVTIQHIIVQYKQWDIGNVEGHNSLPFKSHSVHISG